MSSSYQRLRCEFRAKFRTRWAILTVFHDCWTLHLRQVCKPATLTSLSRCSLRKGGFAAGLRNTKTFRTASPWLNSKISTTWNLHYSLPLLCSTSMKHHIFSEASGLAWRNQITATKMLQKTWSSRAEYWKWSRLKMLEAPVYVHLWGRTDWWQQTKKFVWAAALEWCSQVSRCKATCTRFRTRCIAERLWHSVHSL